MADEDEDDDDALLFPDEEGDATPLAERSSAPPWRVLIVDDEPEVHSITRMVLADFTFNGRGLEFVSAYSAAEAREYLRNEKDFAVILLDVVMEDNDAGLKLVHFIRRDLGDQTVRIVLRTGQPGQAPEREVILDYDINDYKAKAELTAQNLFTTLITAIRSYQDIQTIESSRRGLEQVIYATGNLFQLRSMTQFLSGILIQIAAMLDKNLDAALLVYDGGSDASSDNRAECFRVRAAYGRFEGALGHAASTALEPDNWDFIDKAIASNQEAVHDDTRTVVYFRSRMHRDSAIYLECPAPLSALDRNLVTVFCANAGIGMDNIYLHEQLMKAQESTVYALAQLAEFKDTDTGDHVHRVEQMTAAVARELYRQGKYTDVIDEEFLDQIGLASVLHDVGKVATPDSILQKPGPLTEDERATMREHAPIGARILGDAAQMVDGRTYLSLGAEIAYSHHERWDGGGYPDGLSGTDIPLPGRIVAVADVFDALLMRRPYKEPIPADRALEMIRAERAKHFDPDVVDAFLNVVHQQGLPGSGPERGGSQAIESA